MNYRIIVCTLFLISNLKTFAMDKQPPGESAIDQAKLLQTMHSTSDAAEKMASIMDVLVSSIKEAKAEKEKEKKISLQPYKVKIASVAAHLHNASENYTRYLNERLIGYEVDRLEAYKSSKHHFENQRDALYEDFLSSDIASKYIGHPCSSALMETTKEIIEVIKAEEKQHESKAKKLLSSGQLLSPSVKALHSMLETTQQKYAAKK